MKKSTAVLTFLITATLVLLVARAFVANKISTSGILLSKINDEIKVYKTQNSNLREDLFLKSSLTNISTQASKLGFVKQKENLILAPLPVALKR